MVRTVATIKSIYQARALAEARKVLHASFTPDTPIWRRHIRNNGHTGFTRAVFVELLPSLDLRVRDAKTGALICIGPAIPPA